MSSLAMHYYIFKFYLNASHSTIFNGKQGEVHPHTWEFGLKILTGNDTTVQFNVYENAIQGFFAKYQNTTLNDVAPFDTVIPTLENMVDYFGENLQGILNELGAALSEMEGSETPTRSYLVDYSQTDEFKHALNRREESSISKTFDSLLDSIR